MISLKEGQKVLGTDGKQYLIERGDTLSSLKESKDYRKLFYGDALRKEEFKYAFGKQQDLYLTDAQLRALENIAKDGIIELDKGTSIFDDFAQFDNGIEYIVLLDPYGYFYVNTEGFNYARYIMYIPDEYAYDLF